MDQAPDLSKFIDSQPAIIDNQLATQLILAEHKSVQDTINGHQTRQTQTFNFTILVYGAALTVAAPILEKVVKPAFEAVYLRSDTLTRELVLAISVVSIVYSVVLPAIVFPLCMVFVDVDIFCFALSEQRRRFLRRALRLKDADNEPLWDRTKEPLSLHEAALQLHYGAVPWANDQGAKLDEIARRRMWLFLFAPCFGFVIAAFLGVVGLLEGLGPTSHGSMAVAAFGLLFSGAAICLSYRNIQKAHKIREGRHAVKK